MKDIILKLKKLFFSLLIICLLIFGLVERSSAGGASLFLSPASGTYNFGDLFKISVRANSSGQNINAAEGVIKFDPNILSVVDISKTSSIFNLWTVEPSFSNAQGSVVFGGGTTNDFNGVSGIIFTATFKAKANGRSGINFSSGSILASDGKGTNILSSLTGGNYIVQPKTFDVIAAETIYVPPKNTPDEVKIVSLTHPDQDKWYADSNPKFSWELPEGIFGVKVLLDRIPQSVPIKLYKEQLFEKQIENVDDGIWYFHLQLCNKSGCGKISNYKIQIDAAKPEIFQLSIKEGEKTSNPSPVVILEAKDNTSGVGYYQLKIGNADWFEFKEDQYTLPTLDWGKYAILAKAVDNAGNSALSVAEVEIVPLDSPEITDYPKGAISGSYLVLKGVALPHSTIKIFIQSGDKLKEGQTESDESGIWIYTHNEVLKAGAYNSWAQIADLDGAKSDLSNQVTFIVNPPTYLRIGKIVIDYLSVSIILLILIFILVLSLIWAWTAVREKVRKLRKGTTKAEVSLLRAFKHLGKEVEKQVALMDGNSKMNKKEKMVSENLKKALRSAEKFIGKEIKDIEKELTKN